MKSNTSSMSTLNNIRDVLDYDTFFSQFHYLTSKNRGNPISENRLTSSYYNRTFGKLLKSEDPAAFQQCCNDF